jgi:WXG100 family type VII secretion target
MNPEAVEGMISHLQGMLDQLQTTSNGLRQVADQMESGVLKGRGGAAFSSAMSDRGVASISRLSDYLQDLINELRTAVQAHDDTTQSIAGRFTGR